MWGLIGLYSLMIKVYNSYLYYQDHPLQENENSNITKSVVRNIDILDLPYGVLRCIFSHLTDADLYFNVRCVCRQLRGYVEDYVQIGKSINI